MSVAYFYNSEIRNNGTAVRCWDAGGRPKRYSRPGVDVQEHDLYIMIDDGRDDIEWLPPRPNALWCVDTHLGYEQRLKWAREFDTVFCAQVDGAQKMKVDGIENVHWLPLACHPPSDPSVGELLAHPGKEEILGKHGLEKQYDVCFVGFLNMGVEGDEDSHNRVDFLDMMFKEFPNFHISTNCFFEHAAARYIRSRVGLNLSIKHDLNMRFFEAMSYGVAQLCNRDQLGWKELGFEENVHFYGFESEEEAVVKAHWMLANPVEREETAKRAFDFVRNGHTYADRMQGLIETCLGPQEAQQVQAQDSSQEAQAES